MRRRNRQSNRAGIAAALDRTPPRGACLSSMERAGQSCSTTWAAAMGGSWSVRMTPRERERESQRERDNAAQAKDKQRWWSLLLDRIAPYILMVGTLLFFCAMLAAIFSLEHRHTHRPMGVHPDPNRGHASGMPPHPNRKLTISFMSAPTSAVASAGKDARAVECESARAQFGMGSCGHGVDAWCQRVADGSAGADILVFDPRCDVRGSSGSTTTDDGESGYTWGGNSSIGWSLPRKRLNQFFVLLDLEQPDQNGDISLVASGGVPLGSAAGRAALAVREHSSMHHDKGWRQHMDLILGHRRATSDVWVPWAPCHHLVGTTLDILRFTPESLLARPHSSPLLLSRRAGHAASFLSAGCERGPGDVSRPSQQTRTSQPPVTAGVIRIELLRAFERSFGAVDHYGACLRNRHMQHTVPPELPAAEARTELAHSGMSMSARAKVLVLALYRFALIVERTAAPGSEFVSEQLWHALAAGTLPVYWGPAIAKQWVPCSKCVIWADEFNDIEHLASFLRSMSDDEYLSYFAWKREQGQSQRPSASKFHQLQSYCRNNFGLRQGCMACERVAAHFERLVQLRGDANHGGNDDRQSLDQVHTLRSFQPLSQNLFRFELHPSKDN